jgi:hypothetical protein
MLLPLLILAIAVWLAYGRPKSGFLSDFAKLLDRPEFVDGPDIGPTTRRSVKGEFRGRKVVVMLENRRGVYKIVVSMETQSARTMESYEFTGYRPSREAEMALYALDVKHNLRLTLRDGYLSALGQPGTSFVFAGPGVFEPAKWQSVLDTMHTLAGSLQPNEKRSKTI